MRELTKQGYQAALDESSIGICHFMGGASSKDGREILLVRDKILFFEKEEVGEEEYCHWISEQNKEAEEYIAELERK